MMVILPALQPSERQLAAGIRQPAVGFETAVGSSGGTVLFRKGPAEAASRSFDHYGPYLAATAPHL